MNSSAAKALTRARQGRPDALTSVVLTIPVYLTYHLGILFVDTRNGADLVSSLTLELLEYDVLAYAGATVASALVLCGVTWMLRTRGKLKAHALMPVLAESTLWAALMLVSVGWATQQLTADLQLALSTGRPDRGAVDSLVMAAGAGFHEEIVFRVVLLSGGVRLLTSVLGMATTQAFVVACLASAVAFALVHHMGPLGDAFSVGTFTFRVLAGLFLSAVYVLRGFAVAVYTHFIYDALIFFVLH